MSASTIVVRLRSLYHSATGMENGELRMKNVFFKNTSAALTKPRMKMVKCGKNMEKHSHTHEKSNIKVAFFLNLLFSIIEIIGGLFTNSVAILSDALHDLGDSFSLALAWYFEKVSKKKPNTKYSYGYKRFSLLGAVINSLVLLLGSIFIISESVQRIINPQQPNAKGMLLLAILGIVINGFAVLKLKKGHSLNERAVRLHLLEDVLGWIAVLIGSIILMFVNIPIIDPILSLVIACYILFNIYRNIKDALQVILQHTPDNIDLTAIEDSIKNTEGVKSFHDLHVWSMDGEYNVLSVHVVINENIDDEKLIQIKNTIRNNLKDMNVPHSTIELEKTDETCEFSTSCC